MSNHLIRCVCRGRGWGWHRCTTKRQGRHSVRMPAELQFSRPPTNIHVALVCRPATNHHHPCNTCTHLPTEFCPDSRLSLLPGSGLLPPPSPAPAAAAAATATARGTLPPGGGDGAPPAAAPPPPPTALLSPIVSALACWKVRPGREATRLPRSSRLAAPPLNSALTACMCLGAVVRHDAEANEDRLCEKQWVSGNAFKPTCAHSPNTPKVQQHPPSLHTPSLHTPSPLPQHLTLSALFCRATSMAVADMGKSAARAA